MASVTLKNICKIYDGGVKAVTDFSLEIEDGEVIAFLGPSGCGKTTTLRIIAGLEEITSGELFIEGKLVNEVQPKDRGIAMVFQNYALFPHMTVFENIAFGLQPTEMAEGEIRQRVEAAANVLDLDNLLGRKPKELSGGQKQRVALARALVRKNKVVLLDEPLSNLDAKLRYSMRTELIKLHQKFKTTFIYVTHDQTEAMRIADRIVVMRDGFIQQVGTPEELYFRPKNLFVAGFIGSPQMNFSEKMNLSEKTHMGKKIIEGIRAEDLYADEASLQKFKDYVIEAKVEIREFLGDRVYLHCIGENGQPLVAFAPPECMAKSGDKIKFAANPEKIYRFDKDTEEAIY
jgi:multiple sugar transport system ATP-binding protein